MKKEDYLSLLRDNLPDVVDECAYPENEIVFQHDGDPKHTSIIVKKWLADQKLQTMQWPAQSPDLNPIANLWAIVKRMRPDNERALTNMAELWERVNIEWAKIPHQTIQN